MAFTARQAINPQTMTANWSAGVQRSGAKWAAGALNPRRMFNANPQAAASSWAAGVAAAQPAYQAGLSGADLAVMESNINGVGQQRYSQAGTQKAAKFNKKATALASAISTVVAALPADRSSAQARIARMTAFATAMHAQKGKI